MLEDFLPPEESGDSEQTELTEAQKKLVIDTWNSRPQNPPSLKELTELCFGAGIDGRDKRAKLIKVLLSRHNLKASVSYEYQPKGMIILTDEQKEFVTNNVAKMTCLEMGEVLFSRRLTNLSAEVRAIINFARTLNATAVKYADPKDLITEKYKAPQQDNSMIERINKYVDNPIDRTQFSKNDKQKRWVKALIGYINCYRFVHTINEYETTEDRELFESSFISYVYGKDDLTPEERDQYIILCSEVVISKNILRRIEKFQRFADESIDTEEAKRMSMTYVEMISNLRKEYNDSVKRQQSLMEDLKGKRSKRLEQRVKDNESLVSLVEFWKNEETRKRLIDANIIRRQETKDEIKRLVDMDSLKFEIYGVGEDEILNS